MIKLWGMGKQAQRQISPAVENVADVQFIGRGDRVRYEYTNEDGDVLRAFEGKVIDVCYKTERVCVRVKDVGCVWCGVERVSLVKLPASAARIAV